MLNLVLITILILVVAVSPFFICRWFFSKGDSQSKHDNCWDHNQWPWQIHQRAKTKEDLLDAILTYFPELTKRPNLNTND